LRNLGGEVIAEDECKRSGRDEVMIKHRLLAPYRAGSVANHPHEWAALLHGCCTVSTVSGQKGPSMDNYDIVLADDHIMVRQGIKKIIQQVEAMRVVAEAGDGIELMEILEKITPHLVILDISMPRLKGLAAARKIKQLYPEVKVLMLTMHRDKEYLHEALAVGVDGYLLKEDADVALFAAIEAVRRGQTYVSPLLEK
jgi:CheY-like chemotaxis protein